MKLADYLDERLVWVQDAPGSRDELLRALSDRIAQVLGTVDSDALFDALLEREAKGATATPEGVALPHAMMPDLPKSHVAVVKFADGVDFQSDRCGPCNLVFVLLGPKDTAWEHVRVLARIARVCSGPGALAALRQVTDDAELHEKLLAEDARPV